MKISLGRPHADAGHGDDDRRRRPSLSPSSRGRHRRVEYSNSNAFCTDNCHAVHPEEPRAYAVHTHARVQCVECHMGRLPTLQLMTLKMAHYTSCSHDHRLQAPARGDHAAPRRDNCEGCHWPEVNHSDKVRTKVHFDTDAANTETRTRLVVHTGSGRSAREGDPRHPLAHRAERRVRQRRRAEAHDSVGAHHRQGRQTTTYFDATSKVGRAEMDQKPKQRMECSDCTTHRATRSSTRPTASTTRSRRARSTAACRRSRRARRDHREGVVAARPDAGAGPEVPADHRRRGAQGRNEAGGEGSRGAVREADARDPQAVRVRGEGPHVEVVPEPRPGHKDFPGCFRCHDGKHINEKGEAIRLQCTLCHDIPQVSVDGR